MAERQLGINFKNPQYLLSGSPQQVLAYYTLMDLRLFGLLQGYHPVLAGTIPINIDTEDSDLDILCCFSSTERFEHDLKLFFGDQENFKLRKLTMNGIETVIADFQTKNFPIEIFAQPVPVDQQAGYRHMLIEHSLLLKHGEELRKQIISLKKSGLKTEPAFAEALGLTGDPYISLLELE